MRKIITDRRVLILTLVFATVLIFVGIIWAISKYIPIEKPGTTDPSVTEDAPVTMRECTQPVIYWKEHPELYPAQLVIGGQEYQAADIHAILADESTDVVARLQAQLTGAYLNFLSGADQKTIQETIFKSYAWLVRYPPGSELAEGEQVTGEQLISALESYNLGLAGVAACEPALALTLAGVGGATELLSGTASIMLSDTAAIAPSQTPTPSGIPTQTRMPTRPANTVVVSTPTPTATTTIPVFPTETSSVTPQPSPTSTTEPPTQTNTPTLSPTFPPSPTSTPTFPIPSPTFPPP